MQAKRQQLTLNLFHISKEYTLPHLYWQIPILEIKENLEHACEQFKEVRVKATDFQHHHLIEHAKAMAKAGIMEKEATIKFILRAEEIRQKESMLKVSNKAKHSRLY